VTRPSDPHEHDDLLAPAHAHGPACEHCGADTGIERPYDIEDRLLRALFRAVATQHKLDVYQKGRSKKRCYVFGPNAAALDHFHATLTELWRQLDDEIRQRTADFIREHTGVSPTSPTTDPT
jgi:hypothetical protein